MKRLISIVFFSLLLEACSDENSDLQHYVQQIKQKKTQTVVPVPKFNAIASFKFLQEVQRNPFVTLEDKQERHSNPHRDIQAFAFDTLKFVGVLSKDNDMWGLIELPDSQIIRVHIGDSIGQNHGYVSMIKKEFIQLEESIKNTSGVWKKHIVTLDFNTEG